LTIDQLDVRDDKKAQVYFAVLEKPGRSAQAIVAEVLEAAIRAFPWPKSMRWGAGSLRWVRPLHSILCLMVDDTGAQVVPVEVDGIRAGATTEGHRFMGAGRFAVSSFEDYRLKLSRAKVMLDAAEREAHIWQGATNAAFAAGMEVVEDRALLSEVAGLVEWPFVLMGRIADAFLDLPAEVLQTSMREHQKFFSVRNPKTGRIEGFITVANIEAADGGAIILKGNQKVLSARLSDAKFFWENDLRVAKAGMADWLAGLQAVTFHNKLGSQSARIDRMAALAGQIAPLVGADAVLAEQAARVAKADLRSSMVGEFPELQGVMGMYYARAAGMPDAVADACRDHYAPLGPSDAVPTDPVSVTVALADKIDTLTGFWAIDEKPTGSKDPFALRRAALGVIRLVLTNGVRTSLLDLAKQGLARHDAAAADTIAPDLLAFFHDRLKVFLRDQGIRHDVIDACLAMPGSDDLTLLVKRAQALQGFLSTEDGTNLLQGFKRANNILAQAEAKDGVEYSFGADVKFAETDEERALFAALDASEGQMAPAMAAEDFATAMTVLAGLRAPIDAFFTAVQVNSDNAIVRRNRLNLLHRIRATCAAVADLTKVEG
jgi:glycyl-tRNA synthetase beta chain